MCQSLHMVTSAARATLPVEVCCGSVPSPAAGVNGAGKTTQLQIVMGRLQPDSGEVIKAKRNMKIAYLAQVGTAAAAGGGGAVNQAWHGQASQLPWHRVA